MNVRTQQTTVTFAHPFRVRGTEGILPAGVYRVAIDEEPIPGISFLAYRRVQTLLYTPAVSASEGRTSCLSIDAADLEDALSRDRKQSEAG
ncbi:hypothetical protein ABLE93_01425 [Xanthobacter sp. KR7-65]|uniref:hypothetical protein n=1 Tax=Xanthobacter sp. KR7-65 TaxID=3156612 RepID=UPI0032B4C291